MTVLRHYQQSAIEKLREKIRAGLKRVVLVSPTGSGKGEIAAAIVKNAAANGKRVAFIVNRVRLVKQAVKVFARHGINAGILQGNNTFNAGAGSQVVICSIKTMARRKYLGFDIAVLDEAHQSPNSADYRKFFESHSGIIMIGLTATPWAKGMSRRHKFLEDEPLWQEMVVACSIKMLIEQEFLTDIDVWSTHEQIDLSKVKIKNGDYDETDLANTVNKPKLVGNIVQHYMSRADGRQAVCFCVNVAHSKSVCEEFNAHGIRAVHVDGYMKEEEQDEKLAAFNNHEYQVLCNCTLISEGVDIPSVGVIIQAKPTKSPIKFIQEIGRGLRPYHGKDFCTVLDHAGNFQRLVPEIGWPTEDLEYYLDDGSKKEKTKEKQESLPKVCPSCYMVYKRSIRKCPNCGFEPKSVPKTHDVEEGELVQVVKGSKKKFSMEDKQAIYSALLGWARSKGMKDGAAYHKFKAMVGHYPANTLEKTPGPMIDSVKNWITHENIKWAKSQPNFMKRAA